MTHKVLLSFKNEEDLLGVTHIWANIGCEQTGIFDIRVDELAKEVFNLEKIGGFEFHCFESLEDAEKAYNTLYIIVSDSSMFNCYDIKNIEERQEVEEKLKYHQYKRFWNLTDAMEVLVSTLNPNVITHKSGYSEILNNSGYIVCTFYGLDSRLRAELFLTSIADVWA